MKLDDKKVVEIFLAAILVVVLIILILLLTAQSTLSKDSTTSQGAISDSHNTDSYNINSYNKYYTSEKIPTKTKYYKPILYDSTKDTKYYYKDYDYKNKKYSTKIIYDSTKNKKYYNNYDEKYYYKDYNYKKIKYLPHASRRTFQTTEGILGNEIDKYTVMVKNQGYKGGYFTVKFYFKDYYGDTVTESTTHYIKPQQEERFHYKDIYADRYKHYNWDYKVISKTEIPNNDYSHHTTIRYLN